MQLKPHKQHQKEYPGNVQKNVKKENYYSTNEQIEKLTNLVMQEEEEEEEQRRTTRNRRRKSKTTQRL